MVDETQEQSESKQLQLLALASTRALSVDALDEMGIIQALIYHYNRYRGLKAFLLDIDHKTLAYRGISSFIVATSPDSKSNNEDQINELKEWIITTLKQLNNPNITLVVSCLGSQLYRFSDVIDRAVPPLANIDFAPLHEFDEVVEDARLKYDLLLIQRSEAPKFITNDLGGNDYSEIQITAEDLEDEYGHEGESS
jgi:hypothetical protein